MATIQTAATGRATGEPDRAEVRVVVEAYAEDAATARSAVGESAADVREALAAADVPADQVRTAGYQVRERRQDPSRGDDHPDYRAQHTFALALDDVDAVGRVVDAAVDGGATRVDRVEFGFSSDRLGKLRATALEDAMADARAEAEIIAASEELTVESMTDVETAGASRGRPQPEALAADSGGRGTSFESGPVAVTASVTVTFEAA